MEVVQYAGPTQLLPSQDLLQVIAGCAIVADQCFWMTERNDNIKHNPISAESLDMGVQAALQAYRSHQQSVVDAVVQAFPERDALSVPLLERVNLKSKIPRVEELSEKLNHLVITHRMLKKKLPSVPREESRVGPAE